MIGVVVLLVVLLSAFCYYRTSAPGERPQRRTAERFPAGTPELRNLTALELRTWL